jgi:Transposase zinc-binding domain
MEVERRARQSAPARYRPRRPSQSVLYRCVQHHLETWLAHCRGGHDDAGSVPEYVEREFRRYVECGILAHGFARARCGQCGHDFLVAFSGKGRGVCPSCNTRRMVATAAHLSPSRSAFGELEQEVPVTTPPAKERHTTHPFGVPDVVVSLRYRRKKVSPVFNLFNAQTSDITFYYTSRLPGEPPAGVADTHFHPGEKRSFRVTLLYRF